MRRAITVVVAVLAIFLTVALGRWQLSRAAEKEALQAAIESQAAKPVIDTASLRSATDPMRLVHQSALLKGHWLAERTLFLDNRQMNARVGFFAVTALELDGGGVILVQRGWIPRNFEVRSQLPKVETPTGTVEVHGRIALAPGKLYEPGAGAQGVIRQNLDLKQLESESGLKLMPVVMLQMGPSTEGLQRDWPAVNLGVDKHYGYAFQWFGLATLITGLLLWFQVLRPYFSRFKDSSSHV
jgi:surfeit locus 1 family protein